FSIFLDRSFGIAWVPGVADSIPFVSFLAPLEYRDILANDSSIGSVAVVNDVSPAFAVNVITDTRLYVRHCVQPAIDDGSTTLTEIYSAAIETSLQTNVASRVQIADGSALDCPELYAALDNAISSQVFIERLGAAINQNVGSLRFSQTGGLYRPHFQEFSDNEIQFIKGILWDQALKSKTQDFGSDGSSALGVMVKDQAVRSKVVDPSSPAQKVFEMINRLIGFIEASSFLILPLMVFALLFGKPGFSLATSCLMLLIWTQLWHPITRILTRFMEVQAPQISSANIETIQQSVSYIEHSIILEDMGYMLLCVAALFGLFLIYGCLSVAFAGLQHH
ncbi:MAG: conjugal transfer protein TraG N-terminal domain-containing protein, partial [Pseudomonadota bacterium]